MGQSVEIQRIKFFAVIATLGVILFFAYKIQFGLQQSISNYDYYEKFDCDLFHNSLPELHFENSA